MNQEYWCDMCKKYVDEKEMRVTSKYYCCCRPCYSREYTKTTPEMLEMLQCAADEIDLKDVAHVS